MVIDMLFITVIVCFIVDCSGVMTDIRRLISRLIHKRTKIYVEPSSLALKPFGCSLCVTWWTCLFYLLYMGEFTLAYMCLAAVYALMSSNVSGLLLTVKDIMSTVENLIQKLIR